METRILLIITDRALQTIRYDGRTGCPRTKELRRVAGEAILPFILQDLHHVPEENLPSATFRAVIKKIRVSTWRKTRSPQGNWLRIWYRLSPRAKVVHERHFVFESTGQCRSWWLTQVYYHHGVE